MSVFHDMTCSRCGLVVLDMPLRVEGTKCTCRKGRMEILYHTSSQRDAMVHSSERAALYYSAKEGKYQYPSRNDQPIPDRLRKRGYERVELSSLKALEQHGKKTGALSERAYFDRGSGRGFDE